MAKTIVGSKSATPKAAGQIQGYSQLLRSSENHEKSGIAPKYMSIINDKSDDTNGLVNLRDLINQYNGDRTFDFRLQIGWDPVTNIVTLPKLNNSNDFDNQVLVIKDGKIEVGRNGIIYGTLKDEDAKLINGSIYISEEMFNKLFVNPSEKYGQYDINSDTILKASDEKYLSSDSYQYIKDLEYVYGNLVNNNAAQAQAELVRSLDPLLRKDRTSLLDEYFTHSVSDTIKMYLNLQNEIRYYATLEMMDPALASATLLREIAFNGLDDVIPESLGLVNYDTTVGLAQTSVNRAKDNETILNSGIGRPDELTLKSNDEIMNMLNNDNLAPYFATVQMRALYLNDTVSTARNNGASLDDQYKLMFSIYNNNSIRMDIPPVYTKETYGNQTFEYYKLLENYYNTLKNYNY